MVLPRRSCALWLVLKAVVLQQSVECIGHEKLPDMFHGSGRRALLRVEDQLLASTISMEHADEDLALPQTHEVVTPYTDIPQSWMPQLRRLEALVDAQTREEQVAWQLQGQSQVLIANMPTDVPPKLTREQEIEASKQLTQWKCKSAYGSQYKPSVVGNRTTCKFKNLYYEVANGMGMFVAHTLKGGPSAQPLQSIATGMTAEHSEFREPIRVVEHQTLAEFYQHMASWSRLEEYPGITLVMKPVWHFNVGHALWDGLYPAFVSMMQFGDHEKHFRPFILSMREANVEVKVPGNYKHVESILGQIGQMRTIQRFDLNAGVDSHHKFSEAIVGVGTNSAKLDVNVNYTLGACREFDACRAYRKRIFASFDVGAPTRARQHGPLRVKVILNRRDGNQYKELSQTLQRLANTTLKGFEIEEVDWSPGVHARPNTNWESMQTGDFKHHMEIIRSTDIHISGPGTAQMYQNFLPDGAIHINMGCSFDRSYGFMEEYMAEGAPYFRALYYPWRAENAPLFDKGVMVSLLEQARIILNAGPSTYLPVPVNKNLSPLGKVYKAYAYWLHGKVLSQHELATLVPLQREFKTHDWFGNNFVEDFVYPGHDCLYNCSGRDEHVLKSLMMAYDQHHQQDGWFKGYLSGKFALGDHMDKSQVLNSTDVLESSLASYIHAGGIV